MQAVQALPPGTLPPKGWELVPGLPGYMRLRQLPPPKDGRPPTHEEIAKAVEAYLAPRLDELKGEDADPVDMDEVKTFVATWLVANIKQPKDAPPPPAAQVQTAVNAWMAKHYVKPKDAPPPTDAQVQKAADAWLAKNVRQPRDGEDGVGIESVDLRGNEIRIKLTNGVTTSHNIPVKSVIQAAGGGMSEQHVEDIIRRNPELFIGVPTVEPQYTALVFEAITIDGQQVYQMKVKP